LERKGCEEMKKKKDKIKLSINEDVVKNVLNMPNKIIEDFGEQAEKTRIKAVTILDDLYKQMEKEMVQNKEIDNEQYYILINYDDLHEIYKANDMFIDINNITNHGLYGDEKRLLGIKVLVSGDIKKTELVRKL
jgi:hypothetical protein